LYVIFNALEVRPSSVPLSRHFWSLC
jgi:hypothetical protein